MRYTVLLLGSGIMGELAQGVLEQHPNVELIPKEVGAELPEVDIVFSASWPYKLTDHIVNKKARIGGVNIHTGLLPEGRGSHPLNWSLIWGKQRTGITIHKMTGTYDAGDVYLQHEVPIFDTDTILSLRERVEILFPQVIAAFFEDPEKYIREAKQQNQAHASYAQKRTPEDSCMNMSASDVEKWNLYRSCDPVLYPAFVRIEGKKYLVVNGRLDGGLFRYNLEVVE